MPGGEGRAGVLSHGEVVQEIAPAAGDAVVEEQRVVEDQVAVGGLVEGGEVVEVDPHQRPAPDDHVVKLARGTAPQKDTLLAEGAGGDRVADHREVVELGRRPGLGVLSPRVVVGLETPAVGPILAAVVLNHDELGAPVPPEGPVETVVAALGQEGVLHVIGAPKEFQVVVGVLVALDVLGEGAAAHTLKGESVKLVAFRETGAAEFDPDIAEHTTVVVGVVAAVRARIAFSLGFSAGLVEGSVAVDDHPAPVAGTPLAHGLG